MSTSKGIKIGSIHIDPVSMDKGVTRTIDALNNLHDAGALKSVLVVYTTTDAVTATIAGDYMHQPMLCWAARAITDAVAERMINDLFGDEQEE